jgi:uncharacterized membrane protein YqaE (UPF0057 family)
MILLAIIFPAISFLFRGKIFTAFFCFILQLTLIGWLPASIWAVMSLKNERNERKLKKIIKNLNDISQNKKR